MITTKSLPKFLSDQGWKIDEPNRADRNRVPASVIYFHPEGHPLRHPRADDPIDEDLVQSMMTNGNMIAVVCRNEPVPKAERDENDEPKWRPALCDGSRRTLAALEAERRLLEDEISPEDLPNQHILVKHGDAWVFPLKIEFLPPNTTDAEFLFERQSRDRDPDKKPHSTKVLCTWIAQECAVDPNFEPKKLLAVLPFGWTPMHIEAVNTYPALADELYAYFDELDENGNHNISIGLLPAVFAAAPDDREELLAELVEHGISTAPGATRYLNGKKQAAANAAAVPDEPEASEEDVEEGEAEKVPRPRSDPDKKAKNVKTVVRLLNVFRDDPKLTVEANAFALGAELALGDKDRIKSILAHTEGLPLGAKLILSGFCWRHGVFTAAVQEPMSAKLLTAVDQAISKKGAGTGKKGKKA